MATSTYHMPRSSLYCGPIAHGADLLVVTDPFQRVHARRDRPPGFVAVVQPVTCSRLSSASRLSGRLATGWLIHTGSWPTLLTNG